MPRQPRYFVPGVAAQVRDPFGKVVQVDYWDESKPAFGLRLSSSGARTWVIMSRVLRNGRPTQVRINVGCCGDPKEYPLALSLADVRAKATEMLKRIEAGEDPLIAGHLLTTSAPSTRSIPPKDPRSGLGFTVPHELRAAARSCYRDADKKQE